MLKGDNLKHLGTLDLETERFFLRKFRLDDVHQIFQNWSSDQESARYNAWNVHDNENTTREYVEEWIAGYKKPSYYHWAIIDKKNLEVIGSISVSSVKDRKKYCEIGYTVAQKRWNQGIATEVLMRVLSFLADDVGFETVRAMHDVRNAASGRVMEKSGMIFVKHKTQIFLSGQNLVMKCSVYEYKKVALQLR
ncbi:MAG: GNAT family N-acetyltransferase [Sedimentibacter sp.]|uniref:GNAT family N-acetyltransferase n=1 Tax=Sedimentibacter sp. TaxID=1960295 RepID=UPI0031588AE9